MSAVTQKYQADNLQLHWGVKINLINYRMVPIAHFYELQKNRKKIFLNTNYI